MSSRPVERFVFRQIEALGGWPVLIERIASGETIADIARTIKRPDGQLISRAFLSFLLHRNPERSARIKQAHIEGAAAMVDHALHLVDSASPDRDSVNKAKVQSDTRLRVAGLLDRPNWGEAKQAVNVSVNVASLHIDALRHRVAEPQSVLIGSVGQDGSDAPHEREAQELAVQIAASRADCETTDTAVTGSDT